MKRASLLKKGAFNTRSRPECQVPISKLIELSSSLYKTRHILAVEDLVAVGLGLVLIWFLSQQRQMANQLDL